jgi:hypothetical protein
MSPVSVFGSGLDPHRCFAPYPASRFAQLDLHAFTLMLVDMLLPDAVTLFEIRNAQQIVLFVQQLPFGCGACDLTVENR